MLPIVLLAPLALLQTGHVSIKDAKLGTGSLSAKLGDRVWIEYTGKLTNGKIFDTSVGRNPYELTLGAGEVIKGWDIGIQGMKVGGKRTLTVPPVLAYGAAANGDIPANSTLVFTMELKKLERLAVTITKKGTGPGVGGGDTILLHYRGKLKNGKQFDTSYGHEPVQITIGQTHLVPGFTMGLVGMKLGEKRRVLIPPALGYGSQDYGPIPANSTLYFDLELVKIVK
jgi:FKBP-type peptidyl-prolyl cis-trans isomerase